MDWEVKRLGEFGAFKNGISKAADSFGHGVPFVNLVDVFGKSRLTSAEGLGLVEASHAEIADCGLKQGDTLFVRSSVKPEGVGLATVIDGELPNTVFSGFLLRYRDNELEVGYKRYAFAEAKFRRRVIAASTVSANTNVNQTALKGLFVPVPPLPEQRRIATALSDADAWIESLEKLIEKKKLVKQGTMQALLSGKIRLPGFSGKWVERRLGECGVFRKGTGISREDGRSGSIPAVRYGELYTHHDCIIQSFASHISEAVASRATLLKPGDILFACSGETKEEIGKCAAFIQPIRAYAGGDLLIMTPKPACCDSMFLGYALNASQCQAQKAASGQGDAVVHIHKGAVESIEISLPSTLAEQRAIAEVLSDMDAELAALSREKAKAEQIKQGMMQELLTGKTRLDKKGE